MSTKTVLSILFFVIAISLLILYWLVPTQNINLNFAPKNPNFFIGNTTGSLQFYENMRYPSSEISYTISDCTLQKNSDMKEAFDFIENKTILTFIEKTSGGEIFVTCDEKNRLKEDGFFIAGEGGPSEITKTNNFNVILAGEILLIKKSKCPKPNVAIHELLHALGFDHSANSENIMYNVSDCSQTIGYEIPNEINNIYQYPQYQDLAFENISISIDGKYLSTNISLRNHGLKESENSILKIYADENEITEFNIDSINIGYGTQIISTNIKLPNRNIETLNFAILTNNQELNSSNNKQEFSIKV